MVAFTCYLDEPTETRATIDGQLLVDLAFPPHGDVTLNPSEAIDVSSAPAGQVMADPVLMFSSIPGDVVGGWQHQTALTFAPQPDADDLDANLVFTLKSRLQGVPWGAEDVKIRVIVRDDTTYALNLAPTDGGTVMTTAPDGAISSCTSAGVSRAACRATYGGTTTGPADNPTSAETSVTLSAVPDQNWQFGSWTGNGCVAANGSTATVQMGQARTCSASFKPVLTVGRAGTGSGTVTSSDSVINCGNAATTCSGPYDIGQQVTLTAAPVSPSTFTGWTGAGCPGGTSTSVTVTMAAPVTCTATFSM